MSDPILKIIKRSHQKIIKRSADSNLPKYIVPIHTLISLNFEEQKRKEDSLYENPQFSTPNRAVLEPILTDLNRLWEMRHWIPNPGAPISFYNK